MWGAIRFLGELAVDKRLILLRDVALDRQFVKLQMPLGFIMNNRGVY
jgi:hypothetical protein